MTAQTPTLEDRVREYFAAHPIEEVDARTVAEAIGSSPQCVTNVLTRLCVRNVLVRVRRGVYVQDIPF